MGTGISAIVSLALGAWIGAVFVHQSLSWIHFGIGCIEFPFILGLMLKASPLKRLEREQYKAVLAEQMGKLETVPYPYRSSFTL